MRGFSNNHLLDPSEGLAEFLGERTTSQSNFELWSLGAFPAAVEALPGEGSLIRGELFLVSDLTLRRLDWLESNGTLYQRKPLALKGETEPAWIYLFLTHGLPMQEATICPKAIEPDEDNEVSWRTYCNRKVK